MHKQLGTKAREHARGALALGAKVREHAWAVHTLDAQVSGHALHRGLKNTMRNEAKGRAVYTMYYGSLDPSLNYLNHLYHCIWLLVSLWPLCPC